MVLTVLSHFGKQIGYSGCGNVKGHETLSLWGIVIVRWVKFTHKHELYLSHIKYEF